jgi:TrmH family RNA methyltransferase
MKRLILVRPSGPRNAGMALRIAANFGPLEMVIVAPQRASLLVHPEFEQMAHGVEGMGTRIRVLDTLPEALEDIQHAVGFTARARDQRLRLDWREVRDELAQRQERLALVFGSEVNGLTGEEADLLQELIHIPTSAEHTSLNLAVSVGVVLSHLFTERVERVDFAGLSPVTAQEREFLKARLRKVFGGKIARSEFARKDIMRSIDRVFSRAPLETRDARAWHKMLTALGDDSTPSDFGLDPNPHRHARRENARKKASREERGA